MLTEIKHGEITKNNGFQWKKWLSRKRIHEFTKLRALRAFVPSRLRALGVFVPYELSRNTCLTQAPYLRALRALFVCLKAFLGWIFSPGGTFHLTSTIKGTTNRAVCMRVKETAGKLFKWGNFLSIFKRWKQFYVSAFFFSCLQTWSKKFFSLK